MSGLVNDPPHVFIVRIRKEARDGGGEWRGTVEYRPTQERIHFLHMEKLTEFISQKAGVRMVHRSNYLKVVFVRWLRRGIRKQ